ncbi:hypothetical protein DEI92_00910 [Curtobacterium sp. MCBD17_034]|uniref:alpha/beta fold hydrolase n=1 Tax=unclassified Curtobacterium TaxID=257496 RepID=UPI000DA72463|nr:MULTISPECIES: alpha/beta hydrolase [unclassified Curtobacterium]PZF62107.1 hypothetical protein DEI92_00910 [Curtobacterium sp. MCBD17_034]PZM33958.1 hypothetical protein DEI90_09790 [Curtobacterium sp. MCBD17_031]
MSMRSPGGGVDAGADAAGVLLLHGLTSAAHSWVEVRRALASLGVSSCAVDLPGHGHGHRSGYDVGSMAAGLPAQERPWSVVAAHSLGGAVAVERLRRQRDWARRLVLLDPVLVLRHDQTAALVADNARSLVMDHAEVAAAHPRWSPGTVTSKLVAAMQVDPPVISRVLRAWDRTADLAANGVPTIVLGADPGVEEPSFDQTHARRLERRQRFVIADGAGHSIHRDDPQRVVDEITAMLRDR